MSSPRRTLLSSKPGSSPCRVTAETVTSSPETMTGPRGTAEWLLHFGHLSCPLFTHSSPHVVQRSRTTVFTWV